MSEKDGGPAKNDEARAPAKAKVAAGGLALAVWTQVRRLRGAEGGSGPVEVDTVTGKRALPAALSTFGQIQWPTDRRWLHGDPETAIGFGITEFSEALAKGHEGPLVALGYDDNQFYLVARADDEAEDPMVYRLDHDGSDTLDGAKPLSSFLRGVKSMSTKPSGAVEKKLFDAIRSRVEIDCLDLLAAHPGKLKEAVDPTGLTLLHYAVLARLPDVIDALIARGHSVTTPLKKELSVARHFGWRNTPRSAPGQTPLHSVLIANPNGNQMRPEGRTIHALIAKGADVDATNTYGQTPLLYAASTAGELAEAITILIAAGADPNRGTQFDCPLWAAIGSVDKVRALLAGGANPNTFRGTVHSHAKASLLHYAAFAGYGEVATALIEAGADPDATTAGGQRPIDVARGQAETVLRARLGPAES